MQPLNPLGSVRCSKLKKYLVLVVMSLFFYKTSVSGTARGEKQHNEIFHGQSICRYFNEISSLKNKGKTTMLWNQPGVPHTGWHEVRVTDLDEAVHTCEMCGKEEIRYVHTVQHPTGLILDVGQVCAVKMTGDLATAESNLRQAQNFASAKQRWFRKEWEYETGPFIWKSTRTITTSAVRRANGLWHWDAETATNRSGGYARDCADAQRRIEQYVGSLQY